jgi:hypothetical protein
MKGHKPSKKKGKPYIPSVLQSPNLNIGDDHVKKIKIEVIESDIWCH